MYELEIWGGATASYLARFPKRRFRTLDAAEAYADKVSAALDDLGVKAAHPMEIRSSRAKS